jgi:spectinomycin phosphotransferase
LIPASRGAGIFFVSMIEAPDVPERELIDVLRDAYGVAARAAVFLPLGNDARSFVYRAELEDGGRLFFQLRKGEPYAPSLAVPRMLRDAGIAEVVAPLPTRDGRLAAPLGAFSALVYPFVDGDSAMKRGMTAAQWRAHGSALRRVHDTAPPPEVTAQLPREACRPPSLDAAVDVHAAVMHAAFDNPIRAEAQAFWRERSAQIDAALAAAVARGDALRERGLPLVLCHADIHTANIMVDDAGAIHYVDWDGPMLAPKERDIKFVIGTDIGDPVTPEQERAFLDGYGDAAIDQAALGYFRAEWVVEDLASYGTSIFVDEAWSDAMRADAFDGLRFMFNPRGSVQLALSGHAAGR